jgi:hypothetical protein
MSEQSNGCIMNTSPVTGAYAITDYGRNVLPVAGTLAQ